MKETERKGAKGKKNKLGWGGRQTDTRGDRQTPEETDRQTPEETGRHPMR